MLYSDTDRRDTGKILGQNCGETPLQKNSESSRQLESPQTGHEVHFPDTEASTHLTVCKNLVGRMP